MSLLMDHERILQSQIVIFRNGILSEIGGLRKVKVLRALNGSMVRENS